MANTIGSALILPPEVLTSINKADNAFKQLQTTGTTAANEIGKAFSGIAVDGIKTFIVSIQDATKALKEMAQAADAAAVKAGGTKMGNGTKDLGNDAKQAQTNVTQLASAIDALRQSMYALPKSGDMVKAFTDAFAKQAKEIDDLKKHYEELLKKRQEVADASTGSGSRSSKDGSVGNTMDWDTKVALAKDYAGRFAANKNAFNANEYTQLVDKLRMAQEVLKSSTADLTAAEQKQMLEMVKGLQQRIRMRETEAKLVANKQVSVKEADAYAKQAKTLGELTNAMEMYKRARANVDVTTKAGERQAQELTDKIAQLEQRTKSLTTSTEKKAAADRKAAEAEKRRLASTQINDALTGYNGALSFADTAKTTQQRTQAIKYLLAAIEKLNKADADYQQRVDNLRAKVKELSEAQTAAAATAKQVAKSHRNLMDTGGQLMRQLALVFSVSQIRGYIKQVAQVRGEFEMAQRSLQAILASKSDADKIFSQTLSLALQSPYKIKNLIQYTRQLAAYRIENDKLFDTTKRLADVAAGLGVDMQRMILAYGQVKAAAYLKGTEVRQFTEAGVNVYSELQQFYKEVRGEEYTTGEIVKMISERKVTFEDVEAIFQRMTDKGGMFYNMQLIQSETLQGKMMKFQDALDIMLNDIGTDTQGIITWFIDGATKLTRQWREFAKAAMAVGAIIASYKMVRFVQQTIMATAAYKRLKKENSAFVAGLKVAAIRAKVLWATLKGIVATTAISAGIGLAIEGLLLLISRIVNEIKRSSKAAEEAQTHFEESATSLRLIVSEYEKLKKAREDAETSKDDSFNYDTNFDDIRQKFVEFLKEAKENSMQFDIDPFHLKEEELQEKFDNAIEQYRDFLYIAKRLEYEYVADSGFWEDAIDKDLEQYSRAASVFLNKAPNSITETINMILANDGTYDNVTEAQKRTLERIAKTIQEDRYDLAGLIKDYKELKDIVKEIDPNSTYASPSNDAPIEIESRLNSHLARAKKSFNRLEKAAEEARKEVSAWLETERADIEAVTNPIEKNRLVKSLIDRQALQQEWDEARKQLAAEVAQEEFGVTLIVDEDSVESSVNWAHEYISNFLRDHEYKIKISAEGSIKGSPLDDLYKQGESVVKAYSEAKKRIEQIERGTFAGYSFEEYLAANEQNRAAYEAVRQPVPSLWGETTEAMEANYTAMLNQERESFDDYIRRQYQNQIMQSYIDAGVAQAGDEHTVAMEEAYQRQRMAMAEETARHLGIELEKPSKKGSNSDDPLKERINLLKEMQKRYEKLLQVMSAYDAQQKVMAEYDTAIEEAGLRPFLDADYVPSKPWTADAMERLLPTAHDRKSRVELQKDIAEIETEITFEENEESLRAAKEKVEDAFSGLELFRSLQELGLSTYDIKQVFPEIATSYDDVERIMEEAMGGEEGTKWEEAYEEKKKKLAEQRGKQEVEEYKELVKAYGEHLSEQLQLDMWYHKERLKIQNNSKIDERTREQMQGNLKAQYSEKTNENTWKDFQASGFYTRLFEDIEHQSSRMLRAMQGRLKELRGSMKDLTPAQMRTMTDAQNKVDTQLAVNNPFKGLLKNILTYNSRLRERRELEKEYLALLAAQQAIQAQISGEDGQGGQAQVTQEAKERLDLAYENTEATVAEKKALADEWKAQLDILDTLKKQKNEIDKKIASTDALLVANEQQVTSTREQMRTALEYYDQAIVSAKALCDLMAQFGVETTDSTTTLLDGLSSAGEAVGAYYSGNYGQMVSSGLSALSSFWQFFSGDAAKQEKIEKLQKAIERLQDKVEDLSDAMADAWSTSSITNYEEATVEALEKEIDTYLEMIEVEKSKKDTDSDQIEEWEDAIEDLYEEIEELQESYIQALGGIGESEYKSAAQEFADAWLEAFNTAEDTLDALTDTFDDYWDTLLSTYITTTATEKFLSPLFEMIDEMAEYYASDSYNRNTWAEKLAKLQDLSDEQLEALDDYLSGLMSALGITPNDVESSLSALQQGIQGITEDTGAALESLLNSMRFFLATQQADVAVIKTTLLSMANSTDNSSSSAPMLTELKAQTALLESLDARLSSVTKAGHPEGGRGLKVFMN